VKGTVPIVVKGRSERGKSEKSSTRSAIVNRISCDKNITNPKRQQMQTMKII